MRQGYANYLYKSSYSANAWHWLPAGAPAGAMEMMASRRCFLVVADYWLSEKRTSC
jgi:hypothetical protein